MAAKAHGAASEIVWTEALVNTGFGTVTSYKRVPFNNETLDESFNELAPGDINRSRAKTLGRGGNIATGGSITADFGLRRFAVWLAHLVGDGTISDASDAANFSAATDDLAVTRGEKLKKVVDAVTHYYIVSTAGTGADASLLDTTIADGFVTWGTAVLAKLGTSTPYKHVIAPAALSAEPAKYIAMQKKLSTAGGSAIARVNYYGGRINQLDVNFTQEGIAKATFAFLFHESEGEGITTSGGSLTTVAEVGSGVAGPDDVLAAGYDAYASYTYTSNTTTQQISVGRPITNVGLTIANNFETNIYTMASGRYRDDLPPGIRTVSSRFTAYMEDGSEYNFFKGEETRAFAISIITPNADTVSGEHMLIEMAHSRLSGNGSPKIAGQGIVSMDYTLNAGILADTTSAPDDLKITIIDCNATLPL